MNYTIFSTLNSQTAVENPVLGAPGRVVNTVLFPSGWFDNGTFSEDGFVEFPTRNGTQELIKNTAGTISVWVVPTFDVGTTGHRMVLFSLYNDSGSQIVVFYDDTERKFGFFESEVGEVYEESTHEFTEPFELVTFRWDSFNRELVIGANLVASQSQGAEFIPEYLTVGGLNIGGERSPDWGANLFIHENLKVLDSYVDDTSIFDVRGISLDNARSGFARTLALSDRFAYSSTSVDNQRNSFVICTGAASERSSALRTGGMNARQAYSEAKSGSFRENYLSAPVVSAKECDLSGCIDIESVRDAAALAIAIGQSDVAAALTSISSTLSDSEANVTGLGYVAVIRYSVMHVRGDAALERGSFVIPCAESLETRGALVSGVPGSTSERFVYSNAVHGTVSTRTLAGKKVYLCCCENASVQRRGSLSGLDNLDEERSAWIGGGTEIESFSFGFFSGISESSSEIFGECPCEIPRDEIPCWLTAANSDYTDWLGNFLAWLRDTMEADETLSSYVPQNLCDREFQTSGWSKVRIPSIELLKSAVSRTSEAEEGTIEARIELKVRGYRTGKRSDAVSSRILRCIDIALKTKSVSEICGVYSIEPQLVPLGYSGRVAVSIIVLRVRAVVDPAGVLY